jgi:NTP pyrophosphatase (non-canonical NTP hydrolase)
MTKEIQEMPYQDFVAKLVKSGEVMDKEISVREEELLDAVAAICSHCDTLSQDAFLFFSTNDSCSRPKALEFKHMAVGLVGEAAELSDPIKKLAIYRKEVTSLVEGKTIAENVLEEIGDIMFFHTGYNAITIETNFGDPDVTLLELIEGFLKVWNNLYHLDKITIEAAILYNKEKLSKRYASLSYSDKQAHDRADKATNS